MPRRWYARREKLVIILKVARDMFLDKKGHNYLKRLYQEEAGGYVSGMCNWKKKKTKISVRIHGGWGGRC